MPFAKLVMLGEYLQVTKPGPGCIYKYRLAER